MRGHTPEDLDHWEFWVVPTGKLPDQDSISLNPLKKLFGDPVPFAALKPLIDDHSPLRRGPAVGRRTPPRAAPQRQTGFLHLPSDRVSALVWEDGGNEDQAIAALPLVCVACQHFRHGVDQHCHTLVACNILLQQLQQGQHLTKICKLWARTWQSTAGWAPEMG